MGVSVGVQLYWYPLPCKWSGLPLAQCEHCTTSALRISIMQLLTLFTPVAPVRASSASRLASSASLRCNSSSLADVAPPLVAMALNAGTAAGVGAVFLPVMLEKKPPVLPASAWGATGGGGAEAPDPHAP